MGQCVSSGTSGADNSSSNSNNANNNNLGKPSPRCQASGCQRACDPGPRSRYCTQHAVCRRQGCTRPRYRKGPYCQEHLGECPTWLLRWHAGSLTLEPDTCRVSRCANDQVRVHDARFTNHLCWDHQPVETREAWFNGTLFSNHEAYGAGAPDHHQQQRARRRRSRQKNNPTLAEAASEPVHEPREHISEASSSDVDDDDDASSVGRRLPTIEETDKADTAVCLNRAPRDISLETEPGTPTARRSQKTVHFAESPPRVSFPEKHHGATASVRAVDPVQSPSATRLRSSRHRRSVDGRHATHSSPKTSSSAVTPVVHNREKRRSTGSTPKSADAKRAPRPRSSP
ncbi:hypothetical protein CH063_05536 [Colletotrichum higginsianum]|uniref:Uncharacterized protein n=1 Tax=Colletotrichum higginsianum (strain IMI 349063) TaxID=759273 RepID=H1UZC3_COLHI|nr:hypothetical protein CH063_05536 [Colletotrichum higginsianum]